MFTTCPKCSLKLVVTAADLRVAQGYVRCGRCSDVFNALAGLSDEQQAVLAREPIADTREPVADTREPVAGTREPVPRTREPSASFERDARTSTAPHSPATSSVSSAAPPFRATPPSSGTPAPEPAEEPIPDEALEFDPTTTDVSEVFVNTADDDPTGTFESIVLRSDELPEGMQESVDTFESGEPLERNDTLESSETHELEIDLEALVAVTAVHRMPEVAKQQAPERPERPEPPEQSAQPAQSAPSERSPSPERAEPAPASAAARAPARQPDVAPGSTGEPRPSITQHEAPRSTFEPRSAPEAPRSTPEVRDELVVAELDPLPHDRMSLEEDESVARRHLLIERALWIGSIALAVLLALQIVNHESAQLAGISWLRGPLTSIYSALGMPLAPNWNIHAYEVRQLGAVAGPRNPGTLTVRASVRNTAKREQPLPLLRVTMQDRFGNRIAARDVPPSAYLPPSSSHRTELAAGQRVDAEIAFADPGPNAVGFEIDACLELARGHVACANDAGSSER
ncbi:MAG TPA: DUF3426 domain-containing protein [Steroidobacteraceae bacterium]|nr:DUF3426 domain-containing protein [Steroidobacteraceae bacterium]